MTTMGLFSANPLLASVTRHVACVVAILCASIPAAHAQGGVYACGELRGPMQFGPFDYRTIPGDSKYLVEMAHFPPSVESLSKGSSGSIGADIDYTLRAIPNHPRALLSISRYARRLKTDNPSGTRYSVSCYFDRAIRMAPDDPMPHVLFANYLFTAGKVAEAKQHLDQAEALRGSPSSSDLDYNLGLLYYDVGEYDKAAVAAKRAYALGAQFPALRAKLKAKGKSID